MKEQRPSKANRPSEVTGPQSGSSLLWHWHLSCTSKGLSAAPELGTGAMGQPCPLGATVWGAVQMTKVRDEIQVCAKCQGIQGAEGKQGGQAEWLLR